jgi:outer membrane biosynthesis protein TonB
MTVTGPKTIARLAEQNPLVTALVLSAMIHLALFGSWQLGKQFGWWKHHPAWITNLTKKLARSTPAKARQNQPKPQERVIPMTFIEVDPETATIEAPKDAKYYSSKNAKASNPDPKDLQEVKVDGKQEQVPRLMDNDKPKPFPLQPSTPKPPKAEDFIEPKPKAAAPGDLALLKPKPPSDGQVADTTGDSKTPPKERPRTLAAARAAKGLLTGEKMRQDGGSSSRGKVAFDTRATPFGDYDAAFIAAVEQSWHILLADHLGTQRPGKVVVDFRLTYDGRITDMKVQHNEVGEILSMLCQSAILNPQPYPRWPAAMRQTIGGNSREIRFTFYYN